MDGPGGAKGPESQRPRQSAPDAASLLIRMEQVPFSRWHRNARLVMGSATFFDAFNALSLAFALPTLIRLWHISPKQSGLLISASYVGQLAGALVFSALAEKVGRIRGTTAAIAIMSIMSFGCAVAGNFPTLLASRLVQGIGVGGEMPVAATYINELSRAHGRGRFFLLYEMIFPLGLMATGQIGAWLVPASGWNAIFFLGGIPGLLIAFFGGSPSRIAEMVDLPGTPTGSGNNCRAGGSQHQPQGSGRGGSDHFFDGKPDAARKMERTSLQCLSGAHIDRMDSLGGRLLYRQRAEQLDAESLQHRLSVESATIAARRLVDQCRSSRGVVRVRV